MADSILVSKVAFPADIPGKSIRYPKGITSGVNGILENPAPAPGKGQGQCSLSTQKFSIKKSSGRMAVMTCRII
jgi:hypothetical protein